jgi:hypothetical protein
MQESVESNELDETSVIDWSARPRRQRRAPGPSYWEEYVETDTWYQKKLIEDVPEEELHAALIDEDFEDDEGEEEDEDEEDEDMSEDEGEDAEYIPEQVNSDEEEDESPDASECESECASECASDDSEASEEVQRTGEGE